jgi:MipA family protein
MKPFPPSVPCIRAAAAALAWGVAAGTVAAQTAVEPAAPLAGDAELSVAPPAEGTAFPLGFDQTVTPAETAGISDAGLALPAFLAAGGALDAANPDLVIAVRAGIEVSPAYLGSDQYELGPDAAVRVDLLRFPNGFTFGSGQTVGFRTGLGLRGTARYIPRRTTSNYDELEGLGNIPWTFEAGLGLGYEQRNYRVFADVRYGLIGTNAWVGDVGADAIAYPIDGLTLTLGPRLNFSDDRFTETYFGVTGSEAAASGGNLAAYDAAGGLTSAGVTVGARYLFNERWGLEGAATWDRLLNDAADSPITSQGSADQYSVKLGLTRRISLDF